MPTISDVAWVAARSKEKQQIMEARACVVAILNSQNVAGAFVWRL
jgi:hypothetical protein